jgi:hypothetical protein
MKVLISIKRKCGTAGEWLMFSLIVEYRPNQNTNALMKTRSC